MRFASEQGVDLILPDAPHPTRPYGQFATFP